MTYFEDFEPYIDYIDDRLNSNGKYDEYYQKSAKDIDLILFNPPALCVSKKDLPIHVILIDLTFLKEKGYSKGEICAIILHELGHILNYPIEDKSNIDIEEFYADDFVRNFGFEEELVSGYKKLDLFNLKIYEHSNPIIVKKIQRIYENSEIKVGRIRD